MDNDYNDSDYESCKLTAATIIITSNKVFSFLTTTSEKSQIPSLFFLVKSDIIWWTWRGVKEYEKRFRNVAQKTPGLSWLYSLVLRPHMEASQAPQGFPVAL